MNLLYKKCLKRLFDFVLSLVMLIVLLPLLIILCVLVYFKLGSPILFTQVRPGKDGKPFKLYKFRTMTDAIDQNGDLLTDAERLTRFGKLLRASSLDELPELWNILKGEMSFVGPRPLLTSYLGLYNERQKRRHEVRPGLSGLAQVNGRNTLNWLDRFEFDIHYVENVSFWLDLKIIFLTIKKVIIKEGISSNTSETMEEFKGN